MAILIIGALDTKGAELDFVRRTLQQVGLATTLMDVGTHERPDIQADVCRQKVFEAAGVTVEAVQQKGDRGAAVTAAALGAQRLAVELHRQAKIEGVLGLGGSAGTTVATAAMRALPFGLPKIMVSTLASGQVRPFVGPRDIMMYHSVTDISGLNHLTRRILGNAAHAMAGIVRQPARPHPDQDRPLLCASMFGVTTPCVEAARQTLEKAGWETLVFHAVGTGGEAMESLIADGLIKGVLDVTTTELADELVGGVLSAGPDRLTAAAKRGVPQVVSVGALDMVNFGPRSTVPDRFSDRQFYIHNDNVTLMRTTPQESAQLGEILARKVSQSTAPTAIFLPLKGISAIDAHGKPFWDPAADAALFDAIRQHLSTHVRLVELDLHINDPDFARALATALLETIS